jgi:acyl-CoA dehydrogenase
MELEPAREVERHVAAILEAEAASGPLPALDAATLRRLSRALLPALGAPGSDGVAARLVVARASPALLLAVEATRHLAALLCAFGPDDDERAALARGERIGAVALADAGAAPPARLAPGADGWRLTAEKPLVTNAPLADWIAVFAEADGREVIALVTPHDPGVTVGAPVALLGLDGLAVAPVSAAATLPTSRVLGPLEEGAAARARYARDADLTLAIAGAGLARGVLHAAHRHARAHVRGGQPLMAHQEVAFPLAEVHAHADAAELLCHRAAWLVETGDPEGDTIVRCAKVFCAENAERAASACLQAMGAEGYRRGSVAERAYRDAKGLALAGTSTGLARMAIADALLSRSGDRWT